MVPISQEEQLGRLDPAAVKSLLDRAEVSGFWGDFLAEVSR